MKFAVKNGKIKGIEGGGDMIRPGKWQYGAAAYLFSANLFVFGSSTVVFAVLWHIALVTSSGAWMTYASLAGALPALLVAPFAGVWADRCRRNWLIMGSASGVSAATFALALVYLSHSHELWLLLAISAIRSVGNGLQTPAANALLPQLVPKDQVTRMNGLNQIVQSAMLLVSPLLAGYILSDLGMIWIFIVDAGTALLAVLSLATIRVAKVSTAAPERHAIVGGLRYVGRVPALTAFLLFTVVAFILIAPSSQLSTLYVNRTFGHGVWNLTFNELAWTAGASLGGFYIALHQHLPDKIRVIAVGMAGSGLAFAAMGLHDPFWLYLFFMFVSGIFYPILTAAQTIYIQETVAPAMMGRVFSLWQILSTGIYPIAMLGYGPLADQIPISEVFIVTGLLLVATAWGFDVRLHRLG
ncbi:permease of the major facilitator superfamily protein [Lacticaseibacillus camelliae DSM 22697 = JCM 13995]|uniref:Permease of the major facilitator superfamily protein n=2 Tax=Lacticaseibacillus camelliae TaxID=381742 RepID=A0A0R2EQ14_9LACO|nr:permease of the major facilitator superfamily protein [Lacticaseibacillus camelliae DSM 22697 = JCM 13995]